jgi:hypothetical protein
LLYFVEENLSSEEIPKEERTMFLILMDVAPVLFEWPVPGSMRTFDAYSRRALLMTASRFL